MPDLAVNHRRVAALRVAPHVLPDVQHRPARRVDERAAAALERLQHRDRDAERGQDDDIVSAEPIDRFTGIGEEADAHRPQLLVDVRVVDDLAGQVHAAIGKALARLIRVVDGAVDAVAEAELTRQMHRQAAGAVREVGALDLVDERAVVIVRQHAGDGMLQVEAFAEDEGRHQPSAMTIARSTLIANLPDVRRQLVERLQLARVRARRATCARPCRARRWRRAHCGRSTRTTRRQRRQRRVPRRRRRQSSAAASATSTDRSCAGRCGSES